MLCILVLVFPIAQRILYARSFGAQVRPSTHHPSLSDMIGGPRMPPRGGWMECSDPYMDRACFSLQFSLPTLTNPFAS
ncbi:hypothetical protein L209DRAFT_749636 [Thermothelomyces heterothallicus CBS 203.75]